ncbi:MAG TPA: CsbD family protein [Candidatus Saccharimonadales bacterium]|nr:CsbD family protein [Candidatus Saccharimonadales bacterium]
MNWDQVQGRWKQYEGQLKEKWGKLTDDDLHQIAGKRDQLIGIIQERYGIAKEEVERQIEDFMESLHATSSTTAKGNSKSHGSGR